MDEMPKDVRIQFEALQSAMIQLLDLDPANGWHWVTEAQRRVLQAQMTSVREPERKAG
jgi:hypothetical protein